MTKVFRYMIRYPAVLFAIIFPVVALPELPIATYPANSVRDGNYCAAQLRLALLDLKGSDWYIDNVLFNNRVRTQLFILNHGSLGIGPETPYDYRKGMDMVATLKGALDYMSEKNDTLFFPNEEWSIDTIFPKSRCDSAYLKLIESKTLEMYNANGFVFSGHRTAFFVEYEPFLFRRYNSFDNKSGYTYEPSVMLWTVILQSPFAESSEHGSDYEEYVAHCRNNGLTPLPRITNGLEKDEYEGKDIACYLEYAVGHDRRVVERGTVEKHMEPIIYNNKSGKPVVRLKIMPDTLDCLKIAERVLDNCSPNYPFPEE